MASGAEQSESGAMVTAISATALSPSPHQLVRSLRLVVFPYLLSRALVLAILTVTPFLTSIPPGPDGASSLAFSPASHPATRVGTAILAGDALHYREIAEHGYEKSISRGWFPLFPLVWRLAATVTTEFVFTGTIISQAMFLLGLVLLHPTVRGFGYSFEVADRSILYLTIFPTSHFFSLPLSESLFFVLTVASFYLAQHRRWSLSATSGMLASGTRLAGVTLLPALLVLFFQERNRKWGFLPLLLIPCGALMFFSYLYLSTGDFLAYAHAQGSIGRSTTPVFFLQPLFSYLRHPVAFNTWAFFPLDFTVCLTGMISSIVLARERQWSLAAYLLASAMLPLTAGGIGSMTRYLMVCFPLVIVLAKAGAVAIVDQAIRLVFISLLVWLTWACAAKFGFGMA